MTQQQYDMPESPSPALIDVSDLMDTRDQAEAFFTPIDRDIAHLVENRDDAQAILEKWLQQLDTVQQEDAVIVTKMSEIADRLSGELGSNLSHLTEAIVKYGAQRQGKHSELNGLNSIIGLIRNYIQDHNERIGRLEQKKSDLKKGLGQLALATIELQSISPLEEVPARFGAEPKEAPLVIVDGAIEGFTHPDSQTYYVPVVLPPLPARRVAPPRPECAPKSLPPVPLPTGLKKTFAQQNK
jgi:hypothetical protein